MRPPERHDLPGRDSADFRAEWQSSLSLDQVRQCAPQQRQCLGWVETRKTLSVSIEHNESPYASIADIRANIVWLCRQSCQAECVCNSVPNSLFKKKRSERLRPIAE